MRDESRESAPRVESDFAEHRENGQVGSFVPGRDRFPIAGGDFIGRSPAFNSIREMIKAIAARKCCVIIAGETGVGK